MTTNKITFTTIVLMFLFISDPIRCALADDYANKSFQQLFDFYVYPNSSLPAYDCEIDSKPCEYQDSVPRGKKPAYLGAIYIGTGKINLGKIIEKEREFDAKKITIYKFISIEVDRDLSRGIETIQRELNPQQKTCNGNKFFNLMLEQLKEKIQEDAEKNKDVKEGRDFLRKIQCTIE